MENGEKEDGVDKTLGDGEANPPAVIEESVDSENDVPAVP